MENEDLNEFYARAIAIHTNQSWRDAYQNKAEMKERIVQMFHIKEIMGDKYIHIDICKEKNHFLEEDKSKHTDEHPILQYVLSYNQNGLCMKSYWRGDFFVHHYEEPFCIQKKRLVHSSKKRGKWALHDAFPHVSIRTIEARIKDALLQKVSLSDFPDVDFIELGLDVKRLEERIKETIKE